MVLKGIAASSGIAIAKVYKLQQPKLTIVKKEADKEEELAKLDKAFTKTINDIEAIKQRAAANLSEEELAIFDAHLMMANDPEMKSQIQDMIKNDGVNAEYATQEVANMMLRYEVKGYLWDKMFRTKEIKKLYLDGNFSFPFELDALFNVYFFRFL